MPGSLSRDMAFSIADPALSSLFIVRVPFVYSQVEVVAEQCTATFSKTPSNPRFSAGANYFYPNTSDIDGLSITFYETHDFKVSQWLSQWRNLVFNYETRYYGLPATYKKNIMVEMFSQSSQTAVKTLTYGGCWPTDKGPYELSTAEDTGRITIQAQFSVDIPPQEDQLIAQ